VSFRGMLLAEVPSPRFPFLSGGFLLRVFLERRRSFFGLFFLAAAASDTFLRLSVSSSSPSLTPYPRG